MYTAGMNKLSTADRARVVSALVEGMSINSTVRMTGISKPTILKLIADLGKVCQDYHDENVHGLSTKRVQCDEIWAVCRCKEKNVSPERKGFLGNGDIWTFTGIDADSKLMISWLVGFREANWANRFMADVADRLTNRVQLTTDGHAMYLQAVDRAFGNDIDYAMLVKHYGPDQSTSTRYSPPSFVSAESKNVCGAPADRHVCTSFVERANLTMRMGMRRFTRLTNGFSKKAANHAHMAAIFFTHYNFCRIHMTLKTTPAIAAGLTTKLWKAEDLVSLLDQSFLLRLRTTAHPD